MHLHILTYDISDNLTNSTVFSVYKEFNEYDIEYLSVGSREGREWIEANDIVPLPEEETFHVIFKIDDYERDENEYEYILTEKQSALFLLRFK